MSSFISENLRAFLSIARTGRLTVAARQMGVDHSTLSRRVAALEQTLNANLFDRRATGFVLTPDGERLLSHAERMETLAIRMGAELGDSSRRISGTIRLGTPEGFGTYFLARHLRKFSDAYPDIQIELIANPRMFSLSKREADITVTMLRPVQGRLTARKLVDYELGIYASAAYLGRHGGVANKAELERHRWVGYVEDQMWTTELDYLPQISTNLVPQLRISNVISQMEAVVSGAAIGVLPCFMARPCPELVRLLPNDVRLSRAYWLVTHSDTRDLARIKLMSDFIAVEARADAAFWSGPAVTPAAKAR